MTIEQKIKTDINVIAPTLRLEDISQIKDDLDKLLSIVNPPQGCTYRTIEISGPNRTTGLGYRITNYSHEGTDPMKDGSRNKYSQVDLNNISS